MRAAAVTVALACLLAGTTPAVASPETAPTLARGWWVGAYLTSTTSNDHGTITVRIAPDGAATGSIDATALAAAVGKPRGFRLTFPRPLRVSGSATELHADGKVRARGSVKVMGFSVPVDRTVPVGASLHLVSTTCSLANGDLSGSAQLPSQLSNYDTSVRATFVLQRVDGRPSSSEVRRIATSLTGDFLDAGKTVRALGSGKVTVAKLRRALSAMETLFARANGSAACADTANTEFHRAFGAAVLRLLTSKDLPDADVQSALQVSAQLGLLSNGSAGTDAAGLRSLFEPALRGALDRAKGEAAQASVRVAAYQYGFGELE